MTSEVALLNKYAIALAADSATTVTYWEQNQPKTRFFKGANKIFNISEAHPVGLMTFASANLQGVPWEIVVKSYRDHLQDRCFDHLHEYATDFFDFAASNALIFPRDVQEKQFRAQADRAAMNFLRPIVSEPNYRAANDPKEKMDLMAAGITARKPKVDQAKLLANAAQSDIDQAINHFLQDVIVEFKNDTYFKRWVPDSSIEELARIGITGIYKDGFSSLDSSGIVFAGYGNKVACTRFR